MELEIGGRHLTVSNLAKVLYPRTGFTKGQLIDYYTEIAPVLLPHLKDRPVTLKRFPDGVEGFFFYEKKCPVHRPEWVDTTVVTGGKTVRFCVINDLATLAWTAQLANLELHVTLGKAQDIECPTAMVLDLDPGAPADLVTCCRVALWLRERLAEDGLECFVKTSGSKGMQLYVPINRACTYDVVKSYARRLAELLEKEHPDAVVSKMTKALRRGKVFIDWSQNTRHKTTICVYSLRGRERPTVSTPITWDEVREILERKSAKDFQFEPEEVLARVEEHGDLFEKVLTLKQKFPRRVEKEASA